MPMAIRKRTKGQTQIYKTYT